MKENMSHEAGSGFAGKICLYLEFYHFWGGWLFKKIGTGLLSSYKNQKAMLNHLRIPFVERWDDSCDVLQINTPWLKSIHLIKKVKKQGKKVIIWSHVTVEDAMQVFRFMPIITPLFKKYLIYAYGLADVIVCPTAYTRSLLVVYGLPADRLIVQSNGVNLEKFFTDSQLRVSGRTKYNLNSLTVGTVALAIPRKGIDTFLFLAEKFSNCNFPWFGKVYNSLLVKSLPKNIPPNVLFSGFVDDVNEAFNALDIFIFPSYEENQGMVILEAAAVGLPILVRDIPAYDGWLIHGENCFKAKTNEEFEQQLKQLAADETLRKHLGSQAKKLAQDNSLEALGEKLQAVYSRLGL